MGIIKVKILCKISGIKFSSLELKLSGFAVRPPRMKGLTRKIYLVKCTESFTSGDILKCQISTTKLHQQVKFVDLLWIPPHCWVTGNELAKKGTSIQRVNNNSLPFRLISLEIGLLQSLCLPIYLSIYNGKIVNPVTSEVLNWMKFGQRTNFANILDEFFN